MKESLTQISRDARQEAELETLSALTQTRKLLSAVEDQILTNPTSKFRDFLDVLNSEPSLEHLARKLEEAYSELKYFLLLMLCLLQENGNALIQCCDDSIRSILKSWTIDSVNLS